MATVYPDNTHIPYINGSLIKVSKSKPLTPATVKLRTWLMEHNMVVNDFARECGFTPATIYNIITEQPKTYVSLVQAFAIEYATDGYIPAWLWLDNPRVEEGVRTGRLKGALRFESQVKQFVLKYAALQQPDGVIRAKARMLARLFKVEWNEMKKRAWVDGKKKAKDSIADVSHLFRDPLKDDISEEEHQLNDANEYAQIIKEESADIPSY